MFRQRLPSPRAAQLAPLLAPCRWAGPGLRYRMYSGGPLSKGGEAGSRLLTSGSGRSWAAPRARLALRGGAVLRDVAAESYLPQQTHGSGLTPG